MRLKIGQFLTRNSPPLSRRSEIGRKLIIRHIKRNSERPRRFSGRAANSDANTSRGPRARREP